MFQNESIKSVQQYTVIYVYESTVHYGSRQIGYGPCSVNIHESAV